MSNKNAVITKRRDYLYIFNIQIADYNIYYYYGKTNQLMFVWTLGVGVGVFIIKQNDTKFQDNVESRFIGSFFAKIKKKVPYNEETKSINTSLINVQTEHFVLRQIVDNNIMHRARCIIYTSTSIYNIYIIYHKHNKPYNNIINV